MHYNGFEDYSGCETVKVSHAELKAGDVCPSCTADGQHGKLYTVEPGVLIRLVGQPLITGIRYSIEKFRCTLCGEQYEAKPAEAILNSDKYDASCRTNLAIGRYWLGLPFKRIELWQGMQGVPVPDATQWDKVKELWWMLEPVYETLVELSAQGDVIYYDDTPNKILSQQSVEEEAQKKRRGIHTTAMVCRIGAYETYLFFTSEHHAGENITTLLEKRSSETPLLTMSDASPSNRPKEIDEALFTRWILCFCLVHGRRKFFEIYDFFDQECDFVLGILGKIYRYERHCRERGYSASQRLAYHQVRSTPLMEGLRIWLSNKLLFYEVEPNSGLGQAITYMLKHWTELTQFLRVAGAPLDNSVCERTIKVAIRHRKNSLFFKTPRGALVGDGLMSLIHTAARCGVNSVHYLNTLQTYSEHVATSPELWLPWHYERTLQSLEATTLSAQLA